MERRVNTIKSLGFNSRLDEMQAAILRSKLPIFQNGTQSGEILAQAYLSRLDGEDGIQLPTIPINGKHVWHLFVIRLTGLATEILVKKRMAQQGVATACHYPVPVHMQEAFSDLDIPLGSLPVTEQVASEILSLPLFPGMKIDEVDQVCAHLKTLLSCSFLDSFLTVSKLEGEAKRKSLTLLSSSTFMRRATCPAEILNQNIRIASVGSLQVLCLPFQSK